MGYLEKNRTTIIDYDRRQKTGKVIGSGRMEKQNDVVVAQRQKRKGMSWSKQGSLSLALVTANLPPLAPTRTVYFHLLGIGLGFATFVLASMVEAFYQLITFKN